MATSPDEHEIWTEEKHGRTVINLRFGVGQHSATIELTPDEAMQLSDDLIAAVNAADGESI